MAAWTKLTAATLTAVVMAAAMGAVPSQPPATDVIVSRMIASGVIQQSRMIGTGVIVQRVAGTGVIATRMAGSGISDGTSNTIVVSSTR